MSDIIQDDLRVGNLNQNITLATDDMQFISENFNLSYHWPSSYVCGVAMLEALGDWVEPSEGVIFYLFHESEVEELQPWLDTVPRESERVSIHLLPDGFSFEEKIREICRELQQGPDVRPERVT